MGKIGAETVNMTVNMPEDLRDDLKTLADSSGMTLTAFIRTVLDDAAKRRLTMRLVPLDTAEQPHTEVPPRKRKTDAK